VRDQRFDPALSCAPHAPFGARNFAIPVRQNSRKALLRQVQATVASNSGFGSDLRKVMIPLCI